MLSMHMPRMRPYNSANARYVLAVFTGSLSYYEVYTSGF